MRKSLTLTELLMAAALLGVVVLGASTFHIASDSFLRSTERKTQVLNELTYVIDHLSKNIGLGAGTIDNPGIRWFPAISALDIDQLVVIGGVPAVVNVRYRFIAATNRITFRATSGITTVLTRRWISLAATPLAVNAGIGANGGVSVSNLALAFDPATYNPVTPDERDNPLVSTVDAGGRVTLYFYPLAHSWN